MKKTLPAGGLYAITPDREQTPGELVAAVAEALLGGAVIVQYRRKGIAPDRAHAEASALLGLCERHGALLFINDDRELACAIGAHGVHLGKDDGDYAAFAADPARELLIGVSCYDSLERARVAAAAGVDYVAFGSLYPTSTKPGAVPCAREILAAARAELGLPIVAIGGITPDNAPPVIAAGADFVAAIGGVFDQVSIRDSAACYARLFPSR